MKNVWMTGLVLAAGLAFAGAANAQVKLGVAGPINSAFAKEEKHSVPGRVMT